MTMGGSASGVAGVVTVGQVNTPIGRFGAAFTPRGLARLTFPAESLEVCQAWASRWVPAAEIRRTSPALAAFGQELRAYLAGRRRVFTVALDLRGTPFQLRVWRELGRIPYGTTRSYGSVAAAMGRLRAIRAVGAANGANPVPIVVPCHRVVGGDGRLTGYGGGLALKRWLLQLEGAWPTRGRDTPSASAARRAGAGGRRPRGVR